MANPKKRVPENVPGDFFVDSTCIDCDACRQIAIRHFTRRRDLLQATRAGTPFAKNRPRARRRCVVIGNLDWRTS